MHHRDIACRQLHPWIYFDDGRVVPSLDLSQVDVGQHRSREFERTALAFEVVNRYDSAQHSRKMQNRTRCGFQLLISHGAVGGAEKDSLRGDLLNASARPYRLVV